MKARIKATGEIVDVYCDFKGMKYDFLDYKGKGYMSDEITIFDNEDYEQGWNDGYYEAVSTNAELDYWTRLEHQYAGMAMQGILSGWWSESIANIAKSDREHFDILAFKANELAHALIQKLKEKEERK